MRQQLDLADLRCELDRLARGAPPIFVADLAAAIVSAYGLETSETIRDALTAWIEGARDFQSSQANRLGERSHGQARAEAGR
jgi:hypothetical protein